MDRTEEGYNVACGNNFLRNVPMKHRPSIVVVDCKCGAEIALQTTPGKPFLRPEGKPTPTPPPTSNRSNPPPAPRGMTRREVVGWLEGWWPEVYDAVGSRVGGLASSLVAGCRLSASSFFLMGVDFSSCRKTLSYHSKTTGDNSETGGRHTLEIPVGAACLGELLDQGPC